MEKIKTKWKLGLLPLYALIILLAFSFMHSYTETDEDILFLTPVFEDSRGWDIYTLKDGTKKSVSVQELWKSSGDTYYLSRTMDKDFEQDGYTILELDGVAWQESVFLDDRLLYTVDPTLDNRIGHIEFPREYKGVQGRGEYVRLTLPPGYGGKTLTVALSANPALEDHGLPMVRLSSETVQTALLITDANRLSMPAAVYMTAAVLLAGLFFYTLYHGTASCSVLLLTAASLMQALRVLLNFEFQFSPRFALDFIPADLLIPAACALPMLYMLFQMKRWKTWYAPLILVPLVLSVTGHLMARFPVFSFISAYPYDALLYISLFGLCLFSVLEWKDKNITYRLFTPMFFTIIACIFLAYIGLRLSKSNSVLVGIVQTPFTFLYEALQYSGSILLLLAGSISLFLSVKKAADAQSELTIMSARNDLIQENIQSIQESNTEIAMIRHDMLRHLHMLLDMSHADDKERLQNYLEELTRETESILPVRVCPHPIVNALVTRALARAKKEQIQMDLQVEVPADISITDNDLCTLLMNMLDNALEAVSSLPEEKKRKIELTMHVRGHYLFIETINSCDGTVLINEETGLLESRKGAGHGYGMKAMSEVAKKYMSKLQVKQQHDTVMVRTALLMPGK